VRLHAKSRTNLIVTGEAGSLTITCHDLASFAWGVYTNRAFFGARYGVSVAYSKDINGGGCQTIELGWKKKSDVDIDRTLSDILSENNFFLRAVFSTLSKED